MNFSQYVKGNALEVSSSTVDISELVSFLQSNTHITNLSLKRASIDDEGAEALSKLSNLTLLSLSYNYIGDKEAEVLSKLSNLTVLNLDSNKIGDKGAEALSKLSNLTVLNLDGNEIGDKGAEALANGNLLSLTSIDLRDNRISTRNAETTIFASLEKRRNREKEGRHTTRPIKESSPDSKLSEVQPISGNRLLGSSCVIV